MAHTNGIESVHAQASAQRHVCEHLNRYVQEFAGKHNIRDSGTLAQMRNTVAQLVGRNLLYRDLIASNGLSNASRS